MLYFWVGLCAHTTCICQPDVDEPSSGLIILYGYSGKIINGSTTRAKLPQTVLIDTMILTPVSLPFIFPVMIIGVRFSRIFQAIRVFRFAGFVGEEVHSYWRFIDGVSPKVLETAGGAN